MKALQRFSICRSIFLVMTFFTCFTQLSAFELTPFSVTINSEGRDSSAFIKIKNKHDQAKAIQVNMVTREPDVFDKEKNNQDAEDDFLVYPPQFILEPNSTKLCKITWIGDPLTKRERSYRFIVDELDVDLNPKLEKKSGIRILMRYEGALYVKSADAEEAKVLVKTYKTFIDEEGNEKLSLTLLNNGGIHRLLLNAELSLSSDEGEETVLSSDKLKGLEGSNLLAGREREYHFSVPKNLQGQAVKASFKMPEE